MEDIKQVQGLRPFSLGKAEGKKANSAGWLAVTWLNRCIISVHLPFRELCQPPKSPRLSSQYPCLSSQYPGISRVQWAKTAFGYVSALSWVALLIFCRAPVPSRSSLRAWTLPGELTPSEGRAGSPRLVQTNPPLCFLDLCGSRKRRLWLEIFPGKGDLFIKCMASRRYVPISKGLICKKYVYFEGEWYFKNPRIYMISRARDSVFCSFHIKSTLVNLGALLAQKSPALYLTLLVRPVTWSNPACQLGF